MLRELEAELELEEEAAELQPVFVRNAAAQPPPRARQQQQQPSSCPRPSRQTVSGFARRSAAVRSLPKGEQDKIRTTALRIVRSFQLGCQPVLNIGLVGHADRDPQAGTVFEQRISAERAQAMRRALESLINNPGMVSRIAWQLSSMGASSLAVPNPKSETERARNRRVEIFLGPIPLDGLITGVTVDGGGASIRFASQASPQPEEITFDLYRDQPTPPVPLLPRSEWMRRGAMLGLAQRALTGSQRVKLFVTNDVVQSMEIYRP